MENNRLKNNNVSWLYLAPAIALLLFVFGYSIVSIFWFSLVEWNALTPTSIFNNFESFQDFFSYQHILEVFKNNFLIIIITLPIIVLLAVFMSHNIYTKIFGWRIYRYLFFLPVVIPNVVVGIIWAFFLNRSGPINQFLGNIGLDILQVNWFANIRFALYGLIIAIIWKDIGFAIILFLSRLSTVDTFLFDAAKIDGANEFQIIKHITIPQLSSVIKLYVVLGVIHLMNHLFSYVFIMTSGGPGFSSTVLEYFIYLFAFKFKKIGLASAAGVVLFIITLILIVTYFKISGKSEEE